MPIIPQDSTWTTAKDSVGEQNKLARLCRAPDLAARSLRFYPGRKADRLIIIGTGQSGYLEIDIRDQEALS
jgi:hypothetical protein